MIIGYLHVERISISPAEADPVLIVNTDAVLARAVALEQLQTVPRRRGQIAKLFRAVDLDQLADGYCGDLLEPPHNLPAKDRFRLSIAKRPDQSYRIARAPLYEERRRRREANRKTVGSHGGVFL